MLSTNSTWTNLTTLKLSGNEIDDKGAAALSKNTTWAKLRTLDLSYNEIHVEGASALSTNTTWNNLAYLDITNGLIGLIDDESISVPKARWSQAKIKK